MARKSILMALCIGLLCCPCVARQPKHSQQKAKSYILWVREVRGQALYWVNDKPWGRAPLSGLVEVMGPGKGMKLTVILESHVPIQEMGEIKGLMEQMDISDVHYYVYQSAYPKIGMSEIVWKMDTVPLPKSPPTTKQR